MISRSVSACPVLPTTTAVTASPRVWVGQPDHRRLDDAVQYVDPLFRPPSG